MSDDTTLTQYDDLLKDDADVAAIVIRERLRPVQGARGVFFPPTFAAAGRGKSDYQIDRFGPLADDPERAQKDGFIANRCTVDSVPSQANRLESRLLKYSGTLIPKVTITGSRVGQGSIDLLEVGHRVGDAVVRYSKNGDKDGFEPFEAALQAYVKGDAAPLARLAPTSLVFGHWDSRDSATKKSTKSKARRLIRSEIVAFNVQKVTKRSQYWSSIDPEVSQELEQILKEAKEAAQEDPNTKNPASQLGMTDVPAPESPGGVIAFGPIERTTIIALSGVRALVTFKAKTDAGVTEIDADRTLAMRRYLFALALASAADSGVWDLREGCILVRESKTENGRVVADPTAFTAVKVKHSGEEESFTVPTKSQPSDFLAKAAAAFFGEKEANGAKVPKMPSPLLLAFDPSGAKAAVSTKSGANSGEPKKKEDFVKALCALDAWKGKEAELQKKKLPELKKLWTEVQKLPDTQETAATDSVPTEEAGGEP
ncbi:MAG TPA: type I-U CRISPR-associated RAMP protein Csb1/Cas7u [Thermoanaerobaculales bacterium]|nr:type I-U CRISPR-associated RAMP protein Csb1/Cas7u [Thermoanaerobaculales bacterium]